MNMMIVTIGVMCIIVGIAPLLAVAVGHSFVMTFEASRGQQWAVWAGGALAVAGVVLCSQFGPALTGWGWVVAVVLGLGVTVAVAVAVAALLDRRDGRGDDAAADR